MSFVLLKVTCTSGPYANVWNLKVFDIVEEYVKWVRAEAGGGPLVQLLDC